MKYVLIMLLLSGCVTTGSPEAVFDRYLNAYGNGNAQEMWDLSAPNVHKETKVLQARFLEALRHPDPAQRIPVEGTFGVTAEIIESMDTRTFFHWVIHAIRRQLGSSTIRNAVAGMQRLTLLSMGPNHVQIVYRGMDEREHRLHLQRSDKGWLVQDNPFFPKAPVTTDTNSQ